MEVRNLKNVDVAKVEQRIQQLHRDIKMIDMAIDKF